MGLVVNRRAVLESGVESLVVVVSQVATDLLPEHSLSCEQRAVHQLGLQGVKERLHVGIVLRPAQCGALADPEGGQAISKGRADVLAAPIAVEDQAWRWATPAYRRVEDLARQARIAPPPEPSGGVPDAGRRLVSFNP